MLYTPSVYKISKMAGPRSRRILFGDIEWSLFPVFENCNTCNENTNTLRQRRRLHFFRDAIRMLDEVDKFPDESKFFRVSPYTKIEAYDVEAAQLIQLLNLYLYICTRSGYDLEFSSKDKGGFVKITRRKSDGSLTKGAQKANEGLSAFISPKKWDL